MGACICRGHACTGGRMRWGAHAGPGAHARGPHMDCILGVQVHTFSWVLGVFLLSLDKVDAAFLIATY